MGDDNQRILSRLAEILTEQIRVARRGDLRRVAALAEQADALVKGLSSDAALDPALVARIDGLYRELHLIMSSEKAEIADKLARMARGKSSIGGYLAAAGREPRAPGPATDG